MQPRVVGSRVGISRVFQKLGLVINTGESTQEGWKEAGNLLVSLPPSIIALGERVMRWNAKLKEGAVGRHLSWGRAGRTCRCLGCQGCHSSSGCSDRESCLPGEPKGHCWSCDSLLVGVLDGHCFQCVLVKLVGRAKELLCGPEHSFHQGGVLEGVGFWVVAWALVSGSDGEVEEQTLGTMLDVIVRVVVTGVRTRTEGVSDHCIQEVTVKVSEVLIVSFPFGIEAGLLPFPED